MARYDHLPIWKTAMDLAVLLERAVRGFPRYHKYALGADLRRQAQRICALIVRANEARVVAETGYLKSGHKRRELVYSWAPPGAFPSFHPVVR